MEMLADTRQGLVAQGFSQKFGVDYDEIFAPVVKPVTFRTLLTVSSNRKMSVEHFDIETAFLYGNLTEDNHMKQPVGFQEKGKEHLFVN
jgi:hypothetical protein